jgi:uncharacterized membrane protein
MHLPLRPATLKEAAMVNMIGLGEVLGAIFISFAVVLTLQWVGLVGLMRLMPAKKADVQRAELETSNARRKATELTLITREHKNAA